MPVIFSSSLLAVPSAAARFLGNSPAVEAAAKAVSPAGALYLPVGPPGRLPPLFSSWHQGAHTNLLPGMAACFGGITGCAGMRRPQANVALIAFFNYYYTFLQLDPKDLSEQLKRQVRSACPDPGPGGGDPLRERVGLLPPRRQRERVVCDHVLRCGTGQGASIPGVRPGRTTADYITRELERISVLGSAFLGALAAAPAAVEAATKLTAFRGFAGTSVLIIVGVATDTARKVRAEMAMQKYGDLDTLYDE